LGFTLIILRGAIRSRSLYVLFTLNTVNAIVLWLFYGISLWTIVAALDLSLELVRSSVETGRSAWNGWTDSIVHFICGMDQKKQLEQFKSIVGIIIVGLVLVIMVPYMWWLFIGVWLHVQYKDDFLLLAIWLMAFLSLLPAIAHIAVLITGLALRASSPAI